MIDCFYKCCNGLNLRTSWVSGKKKRKKKKKKLSFLLFTVILITYVVHIIIAFTVINNCKPKSAIDLLQKLFETLINEWMNEWMNESINQSVYPLILSNAP